MSRRMKIALSCVGAGVALMNGGMLLLGGPGATLMLDGLLLICVGVFMAVNYS